MAKSRLGGLSNGSAGNGSSSHPAGTQFESVADVDMLHVPYKGSPPLLVDVLAGRVDLTFDFYTVYEEHVKWDKVRARGVTSKSRIDALPQVPTIAEAGLQGYGYRTGWLCWRPLDAHRLAPAHELIAWASSLPP